MYIKNQNSKIMKIDNKKGLRELSLKEKIEIDGGIIPLIVIGVVAVLATSCKPCPKPPNPTPES